MTVLGKRLKYHRNIRIWKLLYPTTPQNLGIHKSRVNGINLAHGDYILLLDQDDSITDDYLKEQLNAIESADISVCNGYKELEQKKKIIYRDRIKFSLVKNPEIYLKAANQIVSPGQCLIKKSSIPTEWLNYTLQVNGSDDLFLWLLCLAQNNPLFSMKRNCIRIIRSAAIYRMI